MFRRRHLRSHLTLLLLVFLILLDCSVLASENEAKIDEKPDDEPQGTFAQEEGILVFSEVRDIPMALGTDESRFLVVMIYSPSCRHCDSMLTHLQQAAQEIPTLFETIPDTPLPLFAKLDATLMGTALLEEQLGVTSFPTILFIRGTREEAVSVDWHGGPIDTVEDLQATILHYWYRQRGTSPLFELENVEALDTWLQHHAPHSIRHVQPQLNPNLSPEESSHIEWLLSDDDEETEDPLVLFVHCGLKSPFEYQEMAAILVAKRNVLFFQLDSCANLLSNDNVEDGTIVALLLPPQVDWNKWKDGVMHTKLRSDEEAVQHFCIAQSTPIIMWYDRKSVAPIAFANYRKLHAVLFVDVDEYSSSQSAIREFRQACFKSRLYQKEDFVCLVVPQTERRILLTFGIDLWTPLDFQATQGGPVKPVLPTLLITDGRYEGMRRYYLEAAEILTLQTAIQDFVADFWNGKLTPALQSSERDAPRINDSGVQVVTGVTFPSVVLEEPSKHALVYFFAPTCGHCKRFSILWNELARLVKHLGWDSLINVVKMDVTTNEVVSKDFVLDVDAVPDVYFFPRGRKTNPIRYDVVDEFGDGAGRLRDSLDIVEWLLDVADEDDFDEAQLLQLLEASQEDKQSKQEPKTLPNQDENKD